METPPPPAPMPPAQPTPPDRVDLEEQVDSLQRLIGTILVLLLIVSGTLAIFLYWQVRNANRELEAGRQQLDKIQAQQQDAFKKISDFARTHTDFAPIMAKYGMKSDTATSGPPTLPGTAPKK